MTIAEKVNRIDLTAIPKEYAAEIKLIKEETNNFTDVEVLEVYQDNLDILLLKISKRYPESVKPKKKVILKKTEKKKVVKKSSAPKSEKDDGCDEAVEELKKIRIKKKAAADKRAEAPKKQHQTLAAERQVTAFHHAVKTSDLKDDEARISKFAKDLAAVYKKYGMDSVADKILEAAKPKTAAHGALLDVARKGEFSIDSIPGKTFKGYTHGEDWNGFAMPYFGRAEAERIAKAIGGKSEVTSKKTVIDTSTPAFGGDEGETEEYDLTIINTEDGEREVYPVGAGGWVWWDEAWNEARHGAKLDDPFEKFDIDDLDAYERRVYNDVVKASCKKIALGILIANAEGDHSQLSPKLAELAEQVEEETEEEN